LSGVAAQNNRMEAMERLIEQASLLLQADARIEAAWLEGSIAAGHADAWSDIDLNVAVRDGDFEGVMAERHEILGRLGRVLGYYEGGMPDGFLVAANLEGFRRIDLVVFRSSDIGRRSRPDVRVLFDHAGAMERLNREPSPLDLRALVEGQVRGFFFGAFQALRLWNRGEWGSLQMGVYMVLFQHIVPLWLAVDDPANAFRPHLHNERFLSSARRERIEGFLSRLHEAFAGEAPYGVPARQVLSEMYEMAFEALRDACSRWQVAYPEESEASVRATYRGELGLAL
jgi:predicted nucleotidyltransferase